MLKRAIGLFGLLLAICTAQPAWAQQASAPVTVGVDPTRLVITGCASPNAFVQIFNDAAPIGTVVANGEGRFSKTLTFSAQQSGLRSIRMFFDDVNGRTSSVVTSSINLASQSTTVLNQMLPTTIEHEPEPIGIGNFLIFRGTTCPHALINVRLDNNLTLAAQADKSGNWFLIARTDNFYAGAHVYDALISLGGQTSPFSHKYVFTAVGHGPASGGPAELWPPTITEPVDLFLTSTPLVALHGIGPANSQLELFVDDQPAGSVFVNANGLWAFQLNMRAQQHTVKARACDGGRCSDFGNQVRIRFNGDLTLCAPSFELSQYRFHGAAPNSGLDLSLASNASPPPVQLLVDWGDSTIESIELADGNSNIHHVYKQVGQYGSVLSIISDECIQTLYFSVVITPPGLAVWWTLPATGGWLVWAGLRWQKRRRHDGALPPEPADQSRRWYNS